MNRLAERLRLERERQGLSIRELSARTKIREQYIQAIEQGHFSALPMVYMKSFVKTAAQALNIPSAEINALMDEVFSDETPNHLLRKPEPQRTSEQQARKEAKPRKEAPVVQRGIPDAEADIVKKKTQKVNAKPMRNPMTLALIILVGIGAIVLGWSYISNRSNNTAASSSSTTTVVNVDPSAGAVGTTSDGATQDTAKPVLDSMQLTAIITDTAWMTITMDGRRSQQLTLLPGTEHRWSAYDKFAISLGNAGGVKFFRDGQELKPFGKKGEVIRSITITRKDILSSSQPPKPITRPRPVERPPITPAPRRPIR